MALTSRIQDYTNASVIDYNSLTNTIYDSTYWTNTTSPIYTTVASPTTYTINTTNISPPSLKIDGEIVFKGENLSDVIAEIRDALLLLKRDRMREEKYAELKEAAENYLSVLNRLKAIEVVTGEDAIE
jgi:hypothetical protein